MEMRFIGNSGLKVSALAFGTMTFGGKGQFRQMGSVQVDEARRHVNLCLEAGVNFFDTADVYSQGASEEILGQALGRRRDDVILATKAHGRMGDGPNDVGQSRHHLIRACEDSLRRLGTDYIDLYQLHGFDALTPLEETLGALDDLVRSGKVRYIGCSNYSAWHLMKALHVSERKGLERFVSQQVYYSLVARELEYELVPLSLDQASASWSGARWRPASVGKFRRGQAAPDGTRRSQRGDPGTIDEERGYDIIEVLDEIAQEHDATIAQVALNWVLRKQGVTSAIVGARTEEQLRDNLEAASWKMTEEEVRRLDEVSATPPIYPYWHQRRFNSERVPQSIGAGASR
jgi:aryl-alcohol dehydrogenase-like predicted oxidoreductase